MVIKKCFLLLLTMGFFTSAFTSSDPPQLHLPWQPIDGSYWCSKGTETGGTHSGIDKYALDFDMAIGDRISASAAGQAYVHNHGSSGWGLHIKVKHGDYYTLYAHLSSTAPIQTQGQSVIVGETIGYAGNSGNIIPGCPTCDGSHLHTGLFEGDAANDKYDQSQIAPYWVSPHNGNDAYLSLNTFFGCGNLSNSSHFYYSDNIEWQDNHVYCENDGECYIDRGRGNTGGGGSEPDFAWLHAWVEDVATGKDVVDVVQPSQQLKARCEHINDGDDYNDDIEVKALLSNGENVDSSPTTVATDDIQSSNLDHGETHSETFLFNAPSTPGVYNITCDTDTDDDVDEEHESNNKFDNPYVFEVSAYPPSPCPGVDYVSCMAALMIILD